MFGASGASESGLLAAFSSQGILGSLPSSLWNCSHVNNGNDFMLIIDFSFTYGHYWPIELLTV